MRIGVIIMGIVSFFNNAFAINGKDYQSLKPRLELDKFFNGKIKAWGIIQSATGTVMAKFDANLVGKWDGNNGILEEDFYYYDTGRKQHRIWQIKKLDDMHYTGSANDIEGIAKGIAFGNAINWHYEMYVPVNNSSYKFKFDDWMWAMNNDTVINRSYMKKFGITLAEITIFMQKSHD